MIIEISSVVMSVGGRIDTGTAVLFEQKINQWEAAAPELVLDFACVEYISSAGLRVILSMYKKMKAKSKKLIIRNLPDAVRSVFEMSGFINLMVKEEKIVIIRKETAEGLVLSLIGDMVATTLLKKELAELKKQYQLIRQPLTVILDMERLSSLSSAAAGNLGHTLKETLWPERQILIRNATAPVLQVLRDASLSYLIAEDNAPLHYNN